MQADTGTKMVHVGKNTRSRIVSKGISAGNSVNAYRGLVQVQAGSCSSVCFKDRDVDVGLWTQAACGASQWQGVLRS